MSTDRYSLSDSSTGNDTLWLNGNKVITEDCHDLSHEAWVALLNDAYKQGLDRGRKLAFGQSRTALRARVQSYVQRAGVGVEAIEDAIRIIEDAERSL